jgi:hypothetical protein
LNDIVRRLGPSLAIVVAISALAFLRARVPAMTALGFDTTAFAVAGSPAI